MYSINDLSQIKQYLEGGESIEQLEREELAIVEAADTSQLLKEKGEEKCDIDKYEEEGDDLEELYEEEEDTFYVSDDSESDVKKEDEKPDADELEDKKTTPKRAKRRTANKKPIQRKKIKSEPE